MSILPHSSHNAHTCNIDTGLFEVNGFLNGDTQNPYARILCKTRTLRPTLCDGTCRDCRKQREEYTIRRPYEIIHNEIMQSGGDPDYPIPTYYTAKRTTLQTIDEICITKGWYFEKKYGIMNHQQNTPIK